MDTALWVLIIALAVAFVVLAVGLYFTRQRRRSEALRREFGPEYDRALDEYGGRREAEAALRGRKDRVQKLRLRPLSKDERNRFGEQWRAAQAQFVDEPGAAVRNAQRLVDAAMRARGFPVGDFNRQAEDISVEHPHVVSNYRAAKDIADRNDRGDADTEALRQAMVHYRELFVDLVNTADVSDVPAEDTDKPERERPRDERRERPRIDTRRGEPRGR